MTKLVYVLEDGTKETDYKKVQGKKYEVTYEPVVETETPEQKAERLERITKAQKGVAEAYAEKKRLEALTERVIEVTPEDITVEVELETETA